MARSILAAPLHFADIARVATALALAYEYGAVLHDPSTYRWLLHHYMEPTFKQRWAINLTTALFRLVATVGMESYCILALVLAVALVGCRSRAARLVVIAVLLVQRSAYQALSDRAQSYQPSDSYVFWSLLLIGAMDLGSEGVLRGTRFGAYAAAAVGYAFTGLLKIHSPSWVSGQAVSAIAVGVTARPICFHPWVAWLLHEWSAPMTWLALTLELAFPLLTLCGARARRAAVVTSAGMHLVLLVLLDVPWISLYMLAHHASLLAADDALLPSRRALPSSSAVASPMPPPPTPEPMRLRPLPSPRPLRPLPAHRPPSPPPSEAPPASALMTGVGLVLHRAPWLGVRVAILLAVASAPLAMLLDDFASANSLRFLGITPITITSYERPPGDRAGFELFAFGKDVEVVLRTAAPTVGWAYSCNGSCTGDAERDRQLAAQALRTVRVSKRPISLSGFSTRHAPGTQHHNVALLALQSTRSAADRHRMLCAGGDGYSALREVIALRELFGIADGETLVSLDLLARHANAADSRGGAGEEATPSAFFLHMDCRVFWRGHSARLDEQLLQEHTGLARSEALSLLLAPSASAGEVGTVLTDEPSMRPHPPPATLVLISDAVLAPTHSARPLEQQSGDTQCDRWARAGECCRNRGFMLNDCGAACVEAGDGTGTDCALPRGSASAHMAWGGGEGERPSSPPRRSWCALPVACVCVLEVLERFFPRATRRRLVPPLGVGSRRSAALALVVGVLAVVVASLRAPLRRVHERGTVVVTGATSGVGRDAALQLLANGFHVVAVTRQQEVAAARGLLEGLPGSGMSDFARADVVGAAERRLTVVRLDLTQAQDVPRAVAGVMRAVCSGGAGSPLLVGVVHAAGVVGGDDTLAKYRRPDAVATLETHLLGPLTLTQALLPALQFAAGRAVFVSSIAAHYPAASQLTYGASKAALEWAAYALRRDFGVWGGSASVLLPGSIGGGASRMCDHPDVCNLHPSASTTPAILHALLDARPRARYSVGPASAPLLFNRWLQIPAWLAALAARPVPDEVVETLAALVAHPFHGAPVPPEHGPQTTGAVVCARYL